MVEAKSCCVLQLLGLTQFPVVPRHPQSCNPKFIIWAYGDDGLLCACTHIKVFYESWSDIEANYGADCTKVTFDPNFPCGPDGGEVVIYFAFRQVLYNMVKTHLYEWTEVRHFRGTK